VLLSKFNQSVKFSNAQEYFFFSAREQRKTTFSTSIQSYCQSAEFNRGSADDLCLYRRHLTIRQSRFECQIFSMTNQRDEIAQVEVAIACAEKFTPSTEKETPGIPGERSCDRRSQKVRQFRSIVFLIVIRG
jgi:hypothetical protein